MCIYMCIYVYIYVYIYSFSHLFIFLFIYFFFLIYKINISLSAFPVELIEILANKITNKERQQVWKKLTENWNLIEDDKFDISESPNAKNPRKFRGLGEKKILFHEIVKYECEFNQQSVHLSNLSNSLKLRLKPLWKRMKIRNPMSHIICSVWIRTPTFSFGRFRVAILTFWSVQMKLSRNGRLILDVTIFFSKFHYLTNLLSTCQNRHVWLWRQIHSTATVFIFITISSFERHFQNVQWRHELLILFYNK